MKIRVGDIVSNRGSQNVLILKKPVKCDGPGGISYYCEVIHVSGTYIGEHVDKYLVAYNDGTMCVDVISRDIKPLEYIKKLNF